MSKVRRDHWKRKGGKQRLSYKSGCEYTESAAKKMGCGNSPRLQQPSEVANNSCPGYCEGPPPSGLSNLLVETVLVSPTFYIIAWTRGGWQRFFFFFLIFGSGSFLWVELKFVDETENLKLRRRKIKTKRAGAIFLSFLFFLINRRRQSMWKEIFNASQNAYSKGSFHWFLSLGTFGERGYTLAPKAHWTVSGFFSKCLGSCLPPSPAFLFPFPPSPFLGSFTCFSPSTGLLRRKSPRFCLGKHLGVFLTKGLHAPESSAAAVL